MPNLSAGLDAAWRRGLAPELQITVSEWADENRILPATSSEPGRWSTARTPYLRDVMDLLSSASSFERVVFMKGAQIGATEVGLNWIGYVIHNAPGMMLAVQPTQKEQKKNVQGRVSPLIEASPVLRSLVAPARSRDAGNSMFLKAFPGGMLALAGANSPNELSSTPVRYLFLDEVDRYPPDAGGQGDPLALAEQRTATFRGKRRIFMCSTPTQAGVSRIDKAFKESDQRVYKVPCRHCGERFRLTWANISWQGVPRSEAYCVCPACGGIHNEHDKPAMLAAGIWEATAEGDGKTAGFHLSALYSPFETWGEIAVEHGKALGDPVRIMPWTNLKLGEPYEDRDTAPLSPDTLQARAEEWGDLLPAGVVLLTAGVDTQDDRLEVEIVGWGLGEESWSLDYQIIHGDPAKPGPWEVLDALLARTWRHSKAVPDMRISATAIDAMGHRTDHVMSYVGPRLNRRVWAVRGRGGPGVPPWPKRPAKPRIGGVAPVNGVGVDSIKATLMSRLRNADESGPGVYHLPAARDYWWFQGLVSERAVRKWHKGVARIEWVPDKGVRNEPLDCRVYATAALHGLYAMGVSLGGMAADLAALPMREANDNEPVTVAAPRKKKVFEPSW